MLSKPPSASPSPFAQAQLARKLKLSIRAVCTTPNSAPTIAKITTRIGIEDPPSPSTNTDTAQISKSANQPTIEPYRLSSVQRDQLFSGRYFPNHRISANPIARPTGGPQTKNMPPHVKGTR